MAECRRAGTIPVRQPLAGVRVLDMGTRIAAPFCAGILGEQGAEVIKIEDPIGGDGDPHERALHH